MAAYPTASFDVGVATADTYLRFIFAVYAYLGSQEESHGLPMLRNKATVPASERYVLVKLSECASADVTLAVDVTDLYVVGFLVPGNSASSSVVYFFKDATGPIKNLFPDVTNRTPLGFGGSYIALEGEAGIHREDLDLGVKPLRTAIGELLHSSDNKSLARSLMIVIQMVSEAVRIRYISDLVAKSIGNGGNRNFRPDAVMLALENKWDKISCEIQTSTDGNLPNPVQLGPILVQTVNDVFPMIMIMKFGCGSEQAISDHDRFSPVQQKKHNQPLVTSIVGLGGLFLEANGSNVWLERCAGHKEEQKWALYPDGSIRTLKRRNNCLTAETRKKGSKILILDCNQAWATQRWVFANNGTIYNMFDNRVMELKVSDPNLREIISSDHNGKPNQQWNLIY